MLERSLSSKPSTRRPLLTFAFVGLIVLIGSVLYIGASLSKSSPLSASTIELDPSAYRYAPAWITKYFRPPSDSRKDYNEWNQQTLLELHTCIAANNCGTNQRKVAILGSFYFQERVVKGEGGGEGIWGQSMYNTMRSLGYTTFFADDWQGSLRIYRMMPDLVAVVLLLKPADCQNNAECVKSRGNPTGIPTWKIFDFSYWPEDHHPGASRLGGQWIITSHPDMWSEDKGEVSTLQYIGFSIEDQCRQQPVIPLSERHEQIWLFMKLIRYVYDYWFSWEREWFPEITKDLDMQLVGGWRVVQDSDAYGLMEDIEDPDNRIINLQELKHPDFVWEISHSKAMLAVGNPGWSPTPWEALCYGVPFIHPIRNWDRGDPLNRAKWDVQHPVLKRFDEPYVYHVHKGNYTELIAALKRATTTPIDSFIPDFMTEAAFRKRITKFMETDWRAEAVKWLEEKKAANDFSYMFDL